MTIARASHSLPLAAAAVSASPQWVHLMPTGTFRPRDHRGPWTVADAGAVVAASAAHANGQPLVVDYEHQAEKADSKSGPVPAAGWVMRMEARDTGIWGLIEWTEAAAALIGRREYRFISPVFTYDKSNGEVGAIIRAGLTNTPALTLTALARESFDMEMDADMLAALRAALGLADDADWQLILQTAERLRKEAGAPSPDRFAPIETLSAVTAELNRLRRGVAVEHATAIVGTAIENGKMPPALRDWATELCQHNKPAFDAFIDKTGGGFLYLKTEMVPSKLPAELAATSTTIETQIASHLGLSTEDMARNRKARA